MTNEELISAAEEECRSRIENPRESGKWIIWDCSKSPQTMQKFVARVKKETGQPAFCRDGKFGVLAAD